MQKETKEKNKLIAKEKEEIKNTKINKQIDEGLEIGIYDRRTISKQMKEKTSHIDEKYFDGILNPPESIMKIRYGKMFRELCFGLVFTIVIAIIHYIVYSSILISKQIITMCSLILVVISIVLIEVSYRKKDIELTIRGIEFYLMSLFIIFFTSDRYISTNFVTMLLPAIGIGFTAYYLAKVILLERILRAKYLFSLSDIPKMCDEDNETISSEIGMLYNKKAMIDQMDLFNATFNSDDNEYDFEEENKLNNIEEVKEEKKYNNKKRKKRTKAQQERFEKYKAKINGN